MNDLYKGSVVQLKRNEDNGNSRKNRRHAKKVQYSNTHDIKTFW